MAALRIIQFDTAHNCDAFLARNGVSWTLHADKAAAFPTFDVAVRALRNVLPQHPSARIADNVQVGW